MKQRPLEEGDAIVASAHLPGEPGSVGEAREFVRRSCSGLNPHLIDTAELLTSELVTNAILHAGSDITMEVNRTATHVRVSVADSGPGEPVINPSQTQLESGRGLSIVRDLASSWGVDRRESGKAVWFTLSVTGR
jgi:anti-sigma regulatory factor (Ser/Thr protein kinase)